MARKGLPSKYAKMGFKKGWRAYKASKRKRKASNPRGITVKAPRKVKRKMARRRYTRKRRRSSGMTIPLAPIAGLAAGLGGGVNSPIEELVRGNIPAAMNSLAWRYTGVDPADGSFDINRLKEGVLPLIVGLLVHKFVGGRPLNLNAMLARAKVPFIRI